MTRCHSFCRENTDYLLPTRTLNIARITVLLFLCALLGRAEVAVEFLVASDSLRVFRLQQRQLAGDGLALNRLALARKGGSFGGYVFPLLSAMLDDFEIKQGATCMLSSEIATCNDAINLSASADRAELGRVKTDS